MWHLYQKNSRALDQIRATFFGWPHLILQLEHSEFTKGDKMSHTHLAKIAARSQHRPNFSRVAVRSVPSFELSYNALMFCSHVKTVQN